MVLIHVQLLNRELVMEKGLDKGEDNAAIRIWSERTQQEKDDSLTEGCQSGYALFRALVQHWNPSYSYFTFGRIDLVPIIEEYTALIRCLRIQANKAYSRVANVPTFLKKLMSITGMSEEWVAT
ncbi:hypothetical protein PVK06_049116 [Gossypium arboreum]|uniref:DUF7745 domain-containing protein n=1 Tax=Gossypium arboreum TaxID=29729 RepID=A0ABR0MKD1_GOSAR|nr:hypothetical protein PVK06_049116 [Gossypium arboreum]